MWPGQYSTAQHIQEEGLTKVKGYIFLAFEKRFKKGLLPLSDSTSKVYYFMINLGKQLEYLVYPRMCV